MNVRLKYDLPFTAGIYHNGSFYMNNYTLRVLMATVSEDPDDHNTAFERLKYFICNCMESTVFINVDETEQCNQYAQAGLRITPMPGDPVDQLIGIMLYHKLNAVMENRMVVFETELSSAMGEYMVYLHSEEENTLGFVQPNWWTTADLIHSDFVLGNSDNVVSIPQVTEWRDLELAWADDLDVDLDVDLDNDSSGNIVVFADFKPGNGSK
jgi:hypothetical protein